MNIQITLVLFEVPTVMGNDDKDHPSKPINRLHVDKKHRS